MTKDPYSVLGVSCNATRDQIKQAFRDLAKRLHPDLHPGDAAAEARFKEVTGAYGALSRLERQARLYRDETDVDRARPPQTEFWCGQPDPSDQFSFGELFGDGKDDHTARPETV